MSRTSRMQRQHDKQAAKTQDNYRQAPDRIRTAAGYCYTFATLAILAGTFNNVGVPTFGGEAYTEIVSRLAQISGAVALLAAVVLFAAGALLKAAADILVELRRQTSLAAAVAAAPSPAE